MSMSNGLRSLSCGLMLLCLIGTGYAYDVRTHRRLTSEAFNASVLADATTGPLSSLGIEDADLRQFRSITPVDIYPVVASARELVALGAIYEDHPDPTNVFPLPVSEWRFLRHFFDEQRNGDGLGTHPSSREWALEEVHISEQEFSLSDAHDFYIRALTFRERQLRERETILLLQSIGRATHHMQDMSQPAHARGDAHPPYLDNDFYEKYTDIQFDRLQRPFPADSPCGEPTIDLRQFDEAGKFWTNEGLGIAEFTSRNFVSQDTNFERSLLGWGADPRHPEPGYPSEPIFEHRTVAELGLSAPFPNVQLSFLGLQIRDELGGGNCFNSRATTLSILSHDLHSLQFPGFTLNTVNFEENYRILLPRAIAFSTGLINYFFRGKLTLESYSVANSSVEVVVRNDSAAEFSMTDAATAGSEEFSVYYDAQNGERRRLALRNDDLAGTAFGHGQTRTLSFSLPADIDSSLEKPFVLVFNGVIGREPGIAALAMGPTAGAFLVTPNYTPSDSVTGPRVITQQDGVWRLSPQAGAQAGNIDWRGHAPEDVLTWHGPQGRYFGSPSPGASPNIYRGGKVLSVAPATVIGAAISRQGAQGHLIAAVSQDGALRIYRRPYQTSYRQHGLYHALNNPLGWRLIHTESSTPTSPMFFNASGTEGQVFIGAQYRLRISLAGSAASSSQISNVGSFRRLHEQTIDRVGSAETDPGPPRECRASGDNCRTRGTCTDSTGYVHTNRCLVAEAEETVSAGAITSTDLSRENINATVVCADYRGDTEVLCTVEADETLGSSEHRSIGDWRTSRTRTTDQTCTDHWSGPVSYTHEVNETGFIPDSMVLRMGSITIPLSGSNSRRNRRYYTAVQWDWSSEEPLPTVDYFLDDEDATYDTKLMYADARHEILAYEEHVRVDRRLGSGNAVTTRPTYYPAHYNFTAATMRTIQSTSRTIVRADREYVLSDQNIEEEPVRAGYWESAGFMHTRIHYCSDDEPGTSVDDRTVEWNVYNFHDDSIHEKIYDGTTLSISALSARVFVASLPIWIRQRNGSYLQNGVWNHLSGGSIEQVVPTAPDGAAYMPTGITR